MTSLKDTWAVLQPQFQVGPKRRRKSARYSQLYSAVIGLLGGGQAIENDRRHTEAGKYAPSFLPTARQMFLKNSYLFNNTIILMLRCLLQPPQGSSHGAGAMSVNQDRAMTKGGLNAKYLVGILWKRHVRQCVGNGKRCLGRFRSDEMERSHNSRCLGGHRIRSGSFVDPEQIKVAVSVNISIGRRKKNEETIEGL